MQTPSDPKTRVVPIDHRHSTLRLTYHTVGRRIWLSDLTDQEALALQAAINDALIELDNEAYDDNVRR